MGSPEEELELMEIWASQALKQTNKSSEANATSVWEFLFFTLLIHVTVLNLDFKDYREIHMGIQEEESSHPRGGKRASSESSRFVHSSILYRRQRSKG